LFAGNADAFVAVPELSGSLFEDCGPQFDGCWASVIGQGVARGLKMKPGPTVQRIGERLIGLTVVPVKWIWANGEFVRDFLIGAATLLVLFGGAYMAGHYLGKWVGV
jgi:hypothetical protein